MTESQEMLLSYVAARAAEIMADKRKRGIRPLTVTEREIADGIRGNILECMRELVRVGYYRGTRTINCAALEAID